MYGKTFTVNFLFFSLYTLKKTSNIKGDFVPYPFLLFPKLPSISTLLTFTFYLANLSGELGAIPLGVYAFDLVLMGFDKSFEILSNFSPR